MVRWRPGGNGFAGVRAQRKRDSHSNGNGTYTSAPAAVCVFYQQQGVARIDVSGTDGRQLNQKMKEAKCTP
jgi:hypothetical protein